MNVPVFIWGIILTVGFYASHVLALGGFNLAWLWIAWAVIFAAGHFVLGRTMKKQTKTMRAVWLHTTAFGFIVTLAGALGVIFVSFGLLMSLWFLVIGAALFAMGHELKDGLTIASAVILIFSSIFVLAFGDAYFLAGSLLLGVLTLLHGAFAQK